MNSITACATPVSIAQVLALSEVLVLSEVWTLQGIPDEYDEADINRLFSGKVLHTPLALLCLHHTEVLLEACNE